MKTILLTFDYELFFKTSGTVENCLLRPTEDLIKSLARFGIPATFFIDTVYLQELKKQGGWNDFDRVRTQLMELVRMGHRLELHLHPHWLDASYQNGAWTFPHYDRYRLQSLDMDIINNLFREGIELIHSIARTVKPDYTVRAYRAGGWCIQPFKPLVYSFQECSLLFDSSVIPGLKAESEAHVLDFTGCCEKVLYRFADDPVKEDPEGRFVEVPITAFQRSSIDKLMIQLYRWSEFDKVKVYGDGSPVPMKKKGNRWAELIKPDITFLSLEKMPPRLLLSVMKRNKSSLINVLSHPKNLSLSAFRCIELLAAEKDFEFKTFMDL